MTTEVTIKDEAALMGAFAEVKSDANDVNYLICGHFDRNPNIIELRSTGSDTTEIQDQLDDSEVMYCLARYKYVFDMSTTVKFVYIRWIGEKVPPSKKGFYGTIHGSVRSFFNPHHIFIETSSLEDLDKDKIVASLADVIGDKNKVLESNEVSKRQMRGFTQTQLPQKDDRPQFKVSAVATKGLAVEILPEVYEAVSKVRSDSEPETWAVVGFQDKNPKGPMVPVGSGNGDLSELTNCFVDEEAMYGLYRVTIVNSDDIASVKFVYISWVGSKVKPMTKAKISTVKGTAEEVFSPYHLSIYATDLSDISEKDILGKLTKQAS